MIWTNTLVVSNQIVQIKVLISNKIVLQDDNVTDDFDEREVFDLIRNINDPEHPYTLEQLDVVKIQDVKVRNDSPFELSLGVDKITVGIQIPDARVLENVRLVLVSYSDSSYGPNSRRLVRYSDHELAHFRVWPE